MRKDNYYVQKPIQQRLEKNGEMRKLQYGHAPMITEKKTQLENMFNCN